MARTIVGEIYLNTRAIDGGVAGDVQKVIDNAQNTAAKVPVDADTRQAEENVARLAGSIENGIGSAWAAAAAQATAFTVAIVGVHRAVEGVVNQLAGLFDQLAQAQAGFSAILGSQTAGAALLDEIREFARISPFVTQELVNYSQQLLGVGQSAESIVPLLKNTGDLIASVGGDTQNISRVLFTLTQIRSIGRLVGQDAIQLQSSLIPITKLLADFLGKTTAEVKKLQEQGAISADTVFAAINNAGQKVEGAMATATRNISGARSVLSDTVTIMAQDSEFLNQVFDDLVKGILGFADALGENQQLQQDIDAIDRSLTSLYENLQPLIEAFGETGAGLALNGLSILASTLEVLATVLDAFPTEALELIGKGLAFYLTLRAPLALLTYVQSLQRLSGVFSSEFQRRITGATQQVDAFGNVTRASVPEIGRLEAAITKYGTAASVAALAVGTLLSATADSNEAIKTLGTTLQTSAIGAQLGTAFAPGVGTGIGAAVGAGVGLITSFISSAREEARKREAEIEEIGAEAATKFLEGFRLTQGDITTTQDFESFFSQIAPIEDQIRSTTDEMERLVAERDKLLGEGQNYVNDPSAGLVFTTPDQADLDRLEELSNEIKRLQSTADEARATLTGENGLFNKGIYADAVGELALRLSTLRRDSESYVSLVKEFASAAVPDTGNLFDITDDTQRAIIEMTLFGDRTISSAEDLAIFNEAVEETGLSVESFLTLPLETLTQILSGDVPSAVTTARIEIQGLRTAFDEAKKAADEFFKPFGDQIQTAVSALQAQTGLTKAFETFVTERTDASALGLAQAYIKVAEQVAAANEAAFEGTGTEAGVSFLIAQLDGLREELELTQPAFEALLRDMGLLSLYQTGVDPGFTGSLADLAEQLGTSEEALTRLLPSLDDLKKGQTFTINSNILEQIEQLRILTNGFTDFSTVGPEAVATLQAAFDNLDFLGGVTNQLNGIVEEVKRARDEIDIETRRALNPGRPQRVQDQRNAEAIRQSNEQKRLDEIARKAAEEAERVRKEQERLAEQALREQERIQREAERMAEEAAREAERIQKAYEDSNKTLEQALKNAADDINAAAKTWVAGIRERVRDESAVSVGRLISNASDQVSRLDELNRGIQTLQGRGLSSTAIEAVGIDNVTDVRQLRRLLQASPAQLAQLSQLVATRDANAEAIARRERQAETQATIVAAILQAAAILGVNLTPEQAQAMSVQFNVTGNGGELPPNFIEQLLNGQLIVRN